MNIINRQKILSKGIQTVQPTEAMSKKQFFDSMQRQGAAVKTYADTKIKENTVMNFTNSARNMVEESYNNNKANPVALKQELEAVYKGLSNGLGGDDPELKMRFDTISKSYIDKSSNNFNFNNDNELLRNSSDAISGYRRTIEELSSNLITGTDEQKLNAGLAIQQSMLGIDNASNVIGSSGRKLFSGGQISKAMIDAKDDMIANGVKSAFTTSGDKQQFLNDFKNGKIEMTLPDGEEGLVLNTKQELSSVNEAKIVSFMTKAMRDSEEQKFNSIQSMRVDQAIIGRGTLSPTNKDDKDAVDLYYGKLKQTFAELEPIQQVQKVTEMVTKTGIMPKSLKDDLTASINSGSPEQAIQASNLVRNITNEAPNISWQFDGDFLQESLSISRDIQAGETPENIIKNRDIRRQMLLNPEVKKELDGRFNKKKTDFEGLAKESLTFFDKDISGDIQSQQDAVLHYRTLYKNAYTRSGGDFEVARQTANTEFGKTYGITKANGSKKIMRYSPERYYQLDKLPKFDIRDDVKGFVADSGLIGTKKQVSNILDSSVIISDGLTQKQASMVNESTTEESLPSYSVMYKDDNGFLQPLFDESNQPLRYKPRVQKYLSEQRKGMTEKELLLKNIDDASNERKQLIAKNKKYEDMTWYSNMDGLTNFAGF